MKYGSVDAFSSYVIIYRIHTRSIYIRGYSDIYVHLYIKTCDKLYVFIYMKLYASYFFAPLFYDLGDFPADAERRDGSEGTAPSSARLSVSRSTGSLKKVRKPGGLERLATLNENIGDTE